MTQRCFKTEKKENSHEYRNFVDFNLPNPLVDCLGAGEGLCEAWNFHQTVSFQEDLDFHKKELPCRLEDLVEARQVVLEESYLGLTHLRLESGCC